MKSRLTLLLIILLAGTNLSAQVEERTRPAEWEHLVCGARFIDRFLPMSEGTLSGKTWGAKNVIPRYIDNGIEDVNNIWSYWGGNILKDDKGLFHIFVCGWLENSPKGHMDWPNSLVFDAVSDNITGPFVPKKIIAKGHNPEVYRMKDGRYVLYVIDNIYVANSIDGPWVHGKFDFDARDRRIIEGLSNLSFAQREDGSYVMVCRGGGIWISKDGLSTYNQITDKRVYPPVKGRFEDPVIWRDHIQYHLIVNDWLGRIAFYQRSKDGINWVTDPGEAYMPGVAVHKDGKKEDWFKYERIKVYQDEYGRAIQANFAVIDTLKWEDKPNDNHSSKNITIPLNPGLLLTVLDSKPITAKTKTIKVKIAAEKGFNPQTDVDVSSLRFGASTEVNFGRGSKVKKVEKSGNDLIVTFDGKGNGITEDEFAPKLIGKTKEGELIYGYARLPYVDYIEPVLSARAPLFTSTNDGFSINIEVQNFGQVASPNATLVLQYENEGVEKEIGQGVVPAIEPYGKTEVKLSAGNIFEKDKDYSFKVIIKEGKKIVSTFSVKKKVIETKQ
ncbi:hypothetical protein D0T53_07880 [Dysgonomonas sp. 216]|uniref:glycoside hydrolase family protein n=1 Tax=Dysgonomonas sp. 216 TaxID=2302934 RepID=UPI0013D47AAA|nr:glycoside hydrolase family protein [Dysgonomonas sp. 216]NDW18830.1 hypothetical protein [Dysgonomonas sp. 216]